MLILSEKQIELLEKDLLKFMVLKDISSLDRLMDDDLIFTLPNGLTVTKHQDLSNLKSNKMKLISAWIKDLEIRILEQRIALSNSIVMLEGIYDGIDISGQYKYLRIWQIKGDHIRIVGGSGHVLPS